MAGKFLDYDPYTGITETFHKTDNGFVIQSSQDVKPVFDFAATERSYDPGNYRKGNYHLEAVIPAVKLIEWRNELGGDDPMAKHNRKWLLAKLNDPENSKLRTRSTRL